MTTAYYPLRRPPLPVRILQFLAFVLVLLACAFVVFLAGSGNLFLPFMAMFVAMALAVATLVWPTQTVIATLVLVPLSRFISLLVYGGSGSALALRASQLVKDELILFLLLAMINLAVQRRRAPKVYYVDILIVAYLALSAIYLFYNNPDGETTLLTRILAVRQDALYFTAYFIGRSMTLKRQTLELMVRIIVGLSVIVALVAAFQWVVPGLSNAIFNYLGFSRFMAIIGTPHETLVVRSRGIGGADFARASSLFLADLGLAFYQVWVIPLAAALLFHARRWKEQLGFGFFLAMMLGALAMTITRSAVLAALIGLIFVTVRTSGYLKASAVGVLCITGALAGALAMGIEPESVLALVSPKEGSAMAHTDLLEKAAGLVREYPLGLGLGNGSHVANLVSRFGVQVRESAAESWYLQLGLEMGLVAIVLFTAMLAAATISAIVASFRVRDRLLRVVTVATAGAGVSLLAIGIIQPVWSSVQVTYLFWLFVGISVRALQLEREWEAEGEVLEE